MGAGPPFLNSRHRLHTIEPPTSMAHRPKTVLIVDDDEGMRDTLTAILKGEYRVLVADSGEAGLARLDREQVDLMLLDVRMPGIGGFDVLKRVKENNGLIEVIIISAINEVETAVQAMKHGAYHYITKDFEYDALRSLVRNASERQDLSRRLLSLSDELAEQNKREFVVGPSAAVRDVVQLVQKVASLPTTVLIFGESGTGKELLARMIHSTSDRGRGPFIAVNVAATPTDLVETTLFGHERGAFTGAHRQQLGKFELAAGGTLFLDEIGDLRLDLQTKLLRAIQEEEIERVGGAAPIKTDFRLIVATNVDLEKAVKERTFREDLYYRINVIPMKLPPLRERLEDLPELVRLFVDRYNVKFKKRIGGFSDEALEILSHHWWPGNIRELENLVERLVAVHDGEWVTEDDLPLDFHFATLASDAKAGARFQEACETFERSFIVRSLQRCNWNVTATARYLDLPLSTLKHKMTRLEIREIAKRLRGA